MRRYTEWVVKIGDDPPTRLTFSDPRDALRVFHEQKRDGTWGGAVLYRRDVVETRIMSK